MSDLAPRAIRAKREKGSCADKRVTRLVRIKQGAPQQHNARLAEQLPDE
jgi:hypothetical protein